MFLKTVRVSFVPVETHSTKVIVEDTRFKEDDNWEEYLTGIKWLGPNFEPFLTPDI
ncbi:hypothetical protein ACFQU5_10285 [Ureibacillus sp. GCM10028918]